MKVQVHKGERVPLFNSICIETAALCNRTCVFCPNHGTDRPDEEMSWKTLNAIADELGDLNWKGRIASYIYNEPMRDKRLLDIIKLFCKKVPRASFMVSTNGDYIKAADDLEALYTAGVRQVLVNIYSKADAAKDDKVFQRGVDIAQRRHDQITAIAKALGLEFNKSMYGYAPKHVRWFWIEKKFGVRSDSGKLGSSYQLQNRSGNIDWMMPEVDEPLEKMCVRPWRVLNINWKGEAIVCCNDYHGVSNFGNVKDHTLAELWNSTGFNKYRLFLQNKRRDIALCDKCDYGGGAYTHAVKEVTFGKRRDEELLAR